MTFGVNRLYQVQRDGGNLSHTSLKMIFGLNSCIISDVWKQIRHDKIVSMKPFIKERKKKTDAQDDNTLPTLKVSQQEPTSVFVI